MKHQFERLFIEPKSPNLDSAQRRQSKLLSALLLALIAVVGLDIAYRLIFSSVRPLFIVAFTGLLLAYFLSRSRFYVPAALLTLVILSIPPITSTLTETSFAEIAVRSHLIWLVAPIILGSLLFSIRGEIFLVIGYLIVIPFLALLSPQLSFQAISGAWGFIFTISVLIIVAMYHRNQLEQDRQIKLKQSKEFTEGLITSLREGLAIFDAAGKQIDVNPALCQMTGFSRETLIGAKPPHPYWPPEASETIQNAIGKMLKGQFDRFELTFMHQNGTRFPAEFNPSGVRDSQGEIICYFATIHDISDRKQINERLHQEVSFRAAVINRAAEGLCVCHEVPEHPFIYFTEWNERMTEITGYTKEDINQQGWYQAMYPDPEIQQQAIARMERMRIGDDLKAEEWEVVRADGQARTFAISTGIIQTTDGQAHVLGLMQDITEQKRASEALKQSEIYFRSLIEHISDVITIMDVDGTIRYESPSIKRVLGYEPHELNGQVALDFIHPDDVAMTLEMISSRLDIAGPAPSLEIRFKHKDGSWRVLDAIGNNLLADPVMQGIVITSRDITSRKELEQQLSQSQRVEAIGQLTAGIAHDFNNLLTAINGFASLMQYQLPNDSPYQKTLDKILYSGQRAADLVRQLLVFSRKQIIEPKVIDLNLTVIELEKILHRIIGEDIHLKTHLATDLWWVKIDPSQIEQVIVNLVVNARDAMPKGGHLTIETKNILLDQDPFVEQTMEQPVEYVSLVISDTGQGMSDEVKEHIFEPFFTTKETGKGTGLGLATVFSIIQQNNGNIWVYSEAGIGSTFKIHLPRETEGESPSSSSKRNIEILSGSETILLVEDDNQVRSLVDQVLQVHGYTVIVATEGQEALSLVNTARQPISLLLTDVIMPGMSGKSLAQQLQAEYPQLKVLFMSGYTDDMIAHHGILEADTYLLQKPFSTLTLASKVREVLDM